MDPMAQVLGLKVGGALPLMDAVRDGLPLSSLDRVARTVAPTDRAFVFRIVPRATLARRRKVLAGGGTSGARLSPVEGAQVARLAGVWAMALDVWGGEAAARRFMFEPHGVLHGRRPVDVVLENELGRPIVEGVLGRLQAGSAV